MIKTITSENNRKSLFDAADQQYQFIVQTLSEDESARWEHGEIEQWLQQTGTELLRRLYQSHLDLRAQQEKVATVKTEVIGSTGGVRPHRRIKQKRKLETLFGEVTVERLGYSQKKPGVTILYPGDGKLNLAVDQYSHGVRKRIALEAAKVSFTETSKTISETTGAQVGKRQCEELTVKAARDFEGFYANKTQTEAESSNDLLVLTMDGKGIIMQSADLREETAKAAKKEKRTKMRLGPGEKKYRKRMATVGSVYSINRHPRNAESIMTEKSAPKRSAAKPKNKRVWASVKKESKEVIEDVFSEAQSRDGENQRDWVILVDGHKHQLDTIELLIKNQQLKATIILDFIHVLEYLWKAAYCFENPGSEEVEEWVRKRALQILEGKSTDVAKQIKDSATEKKLKASQREKVDKCADYLLKYSHYLDYDQYLTLGYPIATGVIEGACRHLVNDRMEITGARWRLERAEAVLKIRALKASDDFEQYWQFHQQEEFNRNHASKFENPEILLAA